MGFDLRPISSRIEAFSAVGGTASLSHATAVSLSQLAFLSSQRNKRWQRLCMAMLLSVVVIFG